MGLFKNLAGTVLDQFKIGRGTAGDKQLIAGNADATKPEIKFDDTAKKIRYSHDGAVFSELIGNTDNAMEMREESFSTTTANTEGTTVTKYLSAKPGAASGTPSGYAIRVYRNGVLSPYAASLTTANQFKYTSATNKVEVLASGQADTYEVNYLSQGVYEIEEDLVPDWTDSGWLDKWSNIQSYVTKKRDAGGLPHAVMAYAQNSGQAAVANAYLGGALASDGRVYLAPYAQADQTYWHYINSAGSVVAYAHGLGTPPIANAYEGAVFANSRVFFVPYKQATQTNWHYFDIKTNSVVAYPHGLGTPPVNNAYVGGVLAPNGRIYLVPFSQAPETNWHYIDSTTTPPTVTAYAHGKTGLVNYAYHGGVLAPNGRIYLVPCDQSNQTNWHYINYSDATVTSYSGASTVQGAYGGGCISHNGRIFFAPRLQADQTYWHYIDVSSGNIISYQPGLGTPPVAYAYRGCVLAPNGFLYLIPNAQASQIYWHYINPNVTPPTVTQYAHGATCVANAYYSGVLSLEGIIHMVPLAQANQSTWHYIDTKPNSPWALNLCTNPMFNKF